MNSHPSVHTTKGIETAVRHLVTRIPTARETDRVADVLAALPGREFDYASAVYAVGERGELCGVVRLKTLFAALPHQTLSEIMDAQGPVAGPEDDQEHVALLAIRAGIAAVPVVDGSGRLLGVVPPQSLVAILRQEHIEDLQRITGMSNHAALAHDALEAPPLRQLVRRLPWLLVGLAGAILSAVLVSQFEATLSERIAVAFFIPAIVYLADAIGTQTEAMAVRGLSFNPAPIGRLVFGELRAGILLGAVLGGLGFLPTLLLFGVPELAVAVAITIFGAGTVASVAGLVLPWIFSRAGLDPAYGSGPLCTVIQDFLSLLIYFTVVAAISS